MTFPLFDLNGRAALVTGGSRGLGLAMAHALASYGARVVINGVSADNLARAKAELAADGLAVETVAFDATDPKAIAEGVAAAERAAGPIDILFNNAGMNRRAPINDVAEADWRYVVDANLTGPFLVARAVAPGMVARGRGKIVNTASIASFVGRAGIAAYCAAKAGLMALTRSMAIEWGPHGIQANAIAPGYFLTDLNKPNKENPVLNAWVETKTPARRWAMPEELGGIAVYLASPASDFVNGQTIIVDGGFTCAI